MSEYQCPHCPESYTSKSGLSYHIRFRHQTHKNEFKCSNCGKIILSQNNTSVTCNCGKKVATKKQLCVVCNEYKYGTPKTPYTCKECGNDIRAEKMRGVKRNIDCKPSKLWDVPEKDLKGKPDDVKQAIKCCYFVNRKLANRLIAEAKTYDDVVRIRCEYEKENRKEQTFGVVQYG